MAFPWLARGGLAAHNVRRVYLFWSDRSDTWVDISATLERKIEALRAHASQIHDPDGLAERIRSWAAEEGAPIGATAAEALRIVIIDDDEDEGRDPGRLTGRLRQPSSSSSGRIVPQWFQTSASPSARRPSIATISASVRSPAIPARYSSAATLDVAEQLGGRLLGRPVADAHRVDARVAERQRQVALRRVASVRPAAETVEPIAERRQGRWRCRAAWLRVNVAPELVVGGKSRADASIASAMMASMSRVTRSCQ